MIVYLLAIACVALTVALGLVVIIGHPTNAVHLLGYGDIAVGAGLVCVIAAAGLDRDGS